MLVCAVLQACKADPMVDERPARVVDPTSASRAELKDVVSQALNGADVTLADDALMHSSVLIIEQKTYRDAHGDPINGRQLGMPFQFVLRKQEDGCVLVLRSTGQRWALPDTNCVLE